MVHRGSSDEHLNGVLHDVSGIEPEKAQALNSDVFWNNNTIDTTGPPDGWTADDFGEGAGRIFTFDSPDDHILAILGCKTHVGDVNEIVPNDKLDVWWYNGEIDPSMSNWTERIAVDEFMAFHEVASNAGEDGTNHSMGQDAMNLETKFLKDYGYPVLNWTNEISVIYEYIGGDDGEIAFELFYEFVPVERDHLIEELSGRL